MNPLFRSLVVAVVLFLAQAAGALAAGFIVILPDPPVVPPRPPAPTPPPPVHHHHYHPLPPPPRPVITTTAPLEIANPRVEVKIEGQAVTTTIEQEIVNPNDRAMEADFFFPLPRGASIDKASMEVNGRQTEAELLPADKARGIYEDIVRRLKDPALLEYAGRDVFRARVFPVEPRSRKPIRLTYTELLRADDGTLTYRCSLGNARTAAGARVRVSLQADAPLTAIYSPSHPVEIRRDAADPKRATVAWEARGPGSSAPAGDFQLVFAPEKSDLALRVLTYRDPAAGRDEDGYFLLLAAPRPDLKGDQRPAPKDVTFVVDTSGSMAGAKIAQAKKALEYCVNSLNPEDRFEIVRFSSEAEALFGGVRECNEENRRRALAFVRDLRAAGGTAIAEALRTGVRSRPSSGAGGSEDRPFVLAFLTDGQPTVGPTKEEDILAALRIPGAKDVRVFSFGIGTDVNTHLLDRLAESTRAFSQYVLPEEDIEVKVSAFFARVREPALTGLRLEFGDNVRVRQMDPAELPDLFRGDQLLALGRYSGGGAEVNVKLSGRAAGREQTFETRLRFEGTAQFGAVGREFIPRLWATRRVGFLLDEIRLRGENAELRDEVVALARKFGVVTPYTAYLIHDDEERRRVPAAARSLSQLDADAPAMDFAREAFAGFKRDKAGDSAVANAQGQGVLRRAEQAGAAQSENRALAMSAATKAAAPAIAAAPMPNRARSGSMTALPAAAAPPAAPAVAAAADRLDRATEGAARFVNGRAFYQNGSRWVDAAAQNRPAGDPAPRRVQFGSTDYFEMLRKHPEAGPLLALGPNVLVALGDAVYEVYE